MNGDKTPDQVNNEKHYLLSLHCQVGHDASMRKLVLLNQLEYCQRADIWLLSIEKKEKFLQRSYKCVIIQSVSTFSSSSSLIREEKQK
jgi:hypothetical protein